MISRGLFTAIFICSERDAPIAVGAQGVFQPNVGDVRANSRITFAGLPPGYSVQSCQGYPGTPPVPVARRTWGAVKQLYR